MANGPNRTRKRGTAANARRRTPTPARTRSAPGALALQPTTADAGNVLEAGAQPLEPPQREAFAQSYLVHLNQTQAALDAGYSPRTAASQGSRLLRDAKVRTRIQWLKRARADRLQVDADVALSEAVLLARSTMLDVLDPRPADAVRAERVARMDALLQQALTDSAASGAGLPKTIRVDVDDVEGGWRWRDQGDIPARFWPAVQEIGERWDARAGRLVRYVKLHSKTAALQLLLNHLAPSGPVPVTPVAPNGQPLPGNPFAQPLTRDEAVAELRGLLLGALGRPVAHARLASGQEVQAGQVGQAPPQPGGA